MSKKQREIATLLRVYADTEPELYAWLSNLDEQTLPHGGKAIEIKSVLRAGLQAQGYVHGEKVAAPPMSATLDNAVLTEQLSQTLSDVIATDLLASVRQVVEAAVLSAVPQALQGMDLRAPGTTEAGAASVDDGEFYATLEANLFLPED